MTAILERRESTSLWARFCEWITSTENRIYIGWFGVIMDLVNERYEIFDAVTAMPIGLVLNILNYNHDVRNSKKSVSR